MWSLATFGSHWRFCSSDPNSRSGSGTPIDWCADSSAPSAECQPPARASAAL